MEGMPGTGCEGLLVEVLLELAQDPQTDGSRRRLALQTLSVLNLSDADRHELRTMLHDEQLTIEQRVEAGVALGRESMSYLCSLVTTASGQSSDRNGEIARGILWLAELETQELMQLLFARVGHISDDTRRGRILVLSGESSPLSLQDIVLRLDEDTGFCSCMETGQHGVTAEEIEVFRMLLDPYARILAIPDHVDTVETYRWAVRMLPIDLRNRMTALAATRILGDRALPVLTEALESPDGYNRTNAMNCMIALEHAAAHLAPRLLAISQDAEGLEPLVLQCLAVISFEQPLVADTILDILENDQEANPFMMRNGLAMALDQPGEASDYLVELLNEEKWIPDPDALRHLRDLGVDLSGGVPALDRATRAAEAGTARIHAAIGLAELGEPVHAWLPPMLDQLRFSRTGHEEALVFISEHFTR